MSFVSYCRVSTQKQGVSGLGLDAQQGAVAAFVAGRELHGEFVEVESGKHDARPQLHAAIALAKSKKATLVIAKLDRLSRDPDFIGALMKANVSFQACDMPEANKLTIRIMSAIAEHEREAISSRTKAALSEKRKRLALEGKRLGNPAPAASLAKGMATRVAKANEGKAQVREIIETIRERGITTMVGIAGELNRMKIVTPRGGEWSHVQVGRVLAA